MKKINVLTILFALLSVSVWAQLPYNTTLTQSHYNDSKVVIQKVANSNRYEWADGGIRLGYSTVLGVQRPGDWDDKYVVIALNQTSIPYQLTFKYKCTSTIATNPDWYVEESADNTNWSKIWSTVTPTSSGVSVSTDTYTADPIDLSKSTKYIKLCYSGNYGGVFSEIKVSDQAYVNDPVVDDKVITSLDFGTGTISSGVAELSFDVEWCNVNELTVTSDNTDFFTVSPASFGGKAKYGAQTITVGYNRNKEVGEHNGTITITNGSVTKTVTVSGSTTKREQAIRWNAALVATNFTLNAGEVLSGTDLATADNEEAEITYASDDTNVIFVSEDGKTLYAGEVGTALITVTATGNDIYSKKVESKEFTVTSNKKQVIEWDQNFMGLKTNADPNTIELTATATSGGEVTYALEEGSEPCVTLSGNILTITGTPGVAYVIATQAGGEINDEVWISATARKQIKVRDPHAACDEYALADESFTFDQGHKKTFVVKEYSLVGKPTQLTFTAKAGGTQYLWSEREPIYIDQYANFGSGLEWQQVQAITLEESSKNYGPYNLEESATKIRFRSGDYSQQDVSNISIPRKKELVVSETAIEENAERNVKWSKTISVSRSNIDVVDITVVSTDPNCPFEVSKTSIGTDCADRSTETFEVFFTPTFKDSLYTGTITITDGKAVPTTHVITLNVKTVGYNQSIQGFELPESCTTSEVVEMPAVTASSGLEGIIFLSSDSTIAYVEDNKLVIFKAGTVGITAYQAGDDRWNEAKQTETIVIKLTPIEILEAPTASEVKSGETLSMSMLFGGKATVEGSFAWTDATIKPEDGKSYEVTFTPERSTFYATATTTVAVTVTEQPKTYGEYEAQFCEGDSVEFNGKWYYEATTEEVFLEEKNIYGGDSIVVLTVKVLPVEKTEEVYKVYQDDEFEWNDEIYPTNELGTFNDKREFSTVNGCDSIVTLTLIVVEKGVTTATERVEAAQTAVKVFRNGVIYIRREGKEFTTDGQMVK